MVRSDGGDHLMFCHCSRQQKKLLKYLKHWMDMNSDPSSHNELLHIMSYHFFVQVISHQASLTFFGTFLVAPLNQGMTLS